MWPLPYKVIDFLASKEHTPINLLSTLLLPFGLSDTSFLISIAKSLALLETRCGWWLRWGVVDPHTPPPSLNLSSVGNCVTSLSTWACFLSLHFASLSFIFPLVFSSPLIIIPITFRPSLTTVARELISSSFNYFESWSTTNTHLSLWGYTLLHNACFQD